MKFIVDAQLPKSLSDLLNRKGFNSIHTLDLPDKNRTKDNQINTIAYKENRIVITKDTDFLESFIILSSPPKLILVRTGNIPNRELLNIFDANLEILIEMIFRSNLVEVSKTDIAEQK